MNGWTRRIVGWGGWGAVLVAASAAGRAIADVSVTLRSNATIQIGAEDAKNGRRAVTISDIALIDPPTTEEAAKLADIVVVSAGTASTASTVSVAEVRAAMDAAKVPWGRTSLRGSSCALTFSGAVGLVGKNVTGTPGPAARLGLTQTMPQMVDVGENGAETIRQAVCVRLLDLYSVEPTDLRLAFDAADEEFLAQPVVQVSADRRVDVQPGASGGSVRTPLSIAVYEGDRIVATRVIAVQALINRTVVTARAPITRGQMITSDAVEVGQQWMGPNAKVPILTDAAVGQVASRGILAGAVLTATDVTAPVVCKRGDTVWVHALSGPLTVKAKCRAQGTARDGEMVQLKMDGSNRVFSARMSGVGRAVMLTDAEPPERDTAVGTDENTPGSTAPKGVSANRPRRTH